MSKQRKIFLAMAAFIVAMSVTFVALTHLVVRESFEAIVQDAKGKDIDDLAFALIRYYRDNGGAWEEAQGGSREEADLPKKLPAPEREDASYVLVDQDGREVAVKGDASRPIVKRLGFRRSLQLEGMPIGELHYYDPEVANLSKLRIGIPLSILILLAAAAVIFILISLLVAYWIARRLTAPLRQLLPAIDRVGKGEYGVTAPVTTKDELGRVAEAFNAMSAELHRTEEVRRSLVADVAHELRTPLTIVQGKLDLLQQDGEPVPPEQLLPLQDELIRLTRLVDDLHLLSLAEARKLPIDPQPTDMKALLQRLIERVSFTAGEKKIRIELDAAAAAANTRLLADPNRMAQVFLNLLMNAIRYTPAGGMIRVEIEEAELSGTAMTAITVRDTGPGIAPHHLPHLFNRFYRTDEARDRGHGGMGLGLAITKAFVTAHGGTIEVDSKLGEGTAIIVKLPAYSTNKIP
jgi:two-component system, OmpR family, sensor histidine kinase BaeS